jgi:hypothetical protein
MKKLILFALSVCGLAFAQPTFNATTLSVAMTSQQRTMVVASATGFTANTTIAQIEDELLSVLAVNSTTITVQRGASGTRAVKHPVGAQVRVAPPPNFSACGGLTQGGVDCGNQYNTTLEARFGGGLFYPTMTPVTITTAGAATYNAGQVLSGIILRDPNGSSRTDTLPTAVLLVGAVPGATIGTSFRIWIRNDADAAETITIAAGTGGTTSGTMTIAQSNSKEFLIRFTGVASGAEAYTIYSLGTATF